ncbi:unnamed protein product [Dracunculus medinensis]|uniref:BRCT domain-containing protein n=1 Tax=Dracunculus medinensis TaxID=318479 RepID=A0A0N4UMS4_DRAME|nr:unnamed protein product [Dracunculus medinensis]
MLDPKWITTEECMTKTKRLNEIFILPSFHGRVFEHLLSIKSRIYGAIVARTCLKKMERLPKSVHPILSFTLKGAMICFTDISHAVRLCVNFYLVLKHLVKQMALVKYMGGSVSRNFTRKVTHLVAHSHATNSKKYSVAAHNKIPLMTAKWIEDAWKTACSRNNISFLDAKIIKKYRLRLFAGCKNFLKLVPFKKMTCSGIDGEERKKIARIIERHGGIYAGDMERSSSTHLLICKASGEKYNVARKWGWEVIKIVHKRWLGHCLRRKTFSFQHLVEYQWQINI